MKIPARNIVGWVAVALIALIGSNPLLSLLAVTVLGLGFVLLWRPKVSPILFFVFGYQWLQASTKVFWGNLLGIGLDELSQFGGQLASAVLLSLVGLVFLALGLRWGAGPARTRDAGFLREDVFAQPPNLWLKLYLVAFVVATVAQLGADLAPGVSQPLLAVATLKWAFYWIFTYVTFTRPTGLRRLWILVFSFELALGLGGYFSDFRTILVMTILALIPAGLKLNILRIISLVGVILLTVVLGIVWTAIKPEYRDFLNKGARAQVVYVTYADGLAYAATLISALDDATVKRAANDLADRISYVDFFARVVDYVPSVRPYENGAIWGDALIRPFMPRLFFPEKSVINDSDRTNEFTGVRVASADEGASIGIGYMAESYIDFGPYFMMIPILLLGWTLGRFNRWISSYPTTRGLLGAGLSMATLYPAAQFETSITKLIGGLVVTMLICWIVARWVIPLFYYKKNGKIDLSKKARQ